MIKIENKFIIFIILIITFIISFGIFSSYFEKKINKNSNIILINGKALLNNSLLELNKKQKISIGDTIRTVGENALAILEWGDGSVTRLGGNTSIKINELYVSNDLGNLNISFELLSGKSWSNIISFLGEGSYFKEYFRDSEASVRGTIFNVDLASNYLYVINHKLNLTTSNGDVIIVDENKRLNLNTFSFVALEEYLKSFKDNTWENLNYTIDKEFFDGLKKQISNDFVKIIEFKNINLEEALSNDIIRQKVYSKLLSDYQKFNFIKSDDDELFKTKLEIKELLIKLAKGDEKTKLIENTLYDFKDIINSKNYDNLNIILPILSENKDLLGKINFKDYINFIPEELKIILLNNFDNLKGIFGEKFMDFKDLDVNLKNIEEKANSIIKEGLGNGLEKVNNLINK